MSGINPDQNALEQYKKVETHKEGWAIFQVETPKNDPEFIGHKKSCGYSTQNDVAASKKSWDELSNLLCSEYKKSAAYVVVDLCFEANGREQSQIIMISWCPESGVKIKEKMLHGSSMNSLKNQFGAIQKQPHQAASAGDLDFEVVTASVAQP